MHRVFLILSRIMAIAGGVMLAALILLTVYSVLARALDRLFHAMIGADMAPGLARWMIDAGVGPLLGTYEVLEAGIVFVIFAFLPICQITGGHATVDIFTAQMSEGANRVLRGVTEVIFAAVLVLIAVQLYGGMMSKLNSGQVTLELAFPVWWSYAISLLGAVLAALVAVYLACVRAVEMVTGRVVLPADLGAEH